MTCIHCNQSIHETRDDSIPFVHDHSRNGFCDVQTISDVFSIRTEHRMLRTEAEPTGTTLLNEPLFKN